MAEDQDSDSPEEEEKPVAKAPMDPVRKWTLIVLGACLLLLVYYVVADRITPYTSQARVNAVVVPIAAEVSGTVTDVLVRSNQLVRAGDVLFRVDPERYELAVESAEASLQSARQATGASTANVDVAVANLDAARANRLRAQRDAERLRRIKEEDPGAISDRVVDMAEATLEAAVASVEAARASLERARQELGDSGERNAAILQARAALDQARLNLQRTTVRAPDDGIVTEVRVDRGNIAQAGAPLITFLATQDIWLEADFTENNLGNIKPGDEVGIVFDALPGKVLKGSIRTAGFGVNVDSAPLGSLPTIENDRQWLRDAQRFAVLVDFVLPSAEDRIGIRVGAQASVIVYTGDGWLFNAIGKIRLRVLSLVTYLV